MITPPPRRRIDGRAATEQLTTPITLTRRKKRSSWRSSTEGLVVLHQVLAGVVDEDVDTPEPVDGGVDRRLHPVLVGHVTRDRERRMSRGFQLLGERGPGLGVDVGDDGRRALGRERPREGAPEADPAAGDEGDLPVEPHEVLLLALREESPTLSLFDNARRHA